MVKDRRDYSPRQNERRSPSPRMNRNYSGRDDYRDERKSPQRYERAKYSPSRSLSPRRSYDRRSYDGRRSPRDKDDYHSRSAASPEIGNSKSF